MKPFSFFITLLFLSNLWMKSAPRTWTDVQGRRVTGDFETIRGDIIVLRVGTQSYAFPISRLTAADQLFARSLASKNPSESQDGKRQTTDWPRWRGPNGDGVSREADLLAQWPKNGPSLLWSTNNLGKGYSSIIVVGDRIFTLGEAGGATSLYALDRATGRKAWESPIRGGGGVNGTPAYDKEFSLVYGLTKNGNLVGVRASDGKLVWQKNFERDFGGKMMSGWGYSESPLLDGSWLICSPGAPNAAIVALDKKTGQEIWRTPFPRDMGTKGKDGAGYGSVSIVEIGGKKQYVQMTGRGVLAVDARSGRPLWHYNKIANGTANIPSVIVDGDHIFASTGYGDGGSALLRITTSGIREIKYYSAEELQNHHGGMVLLDGYVYGGHGHNRGEPFCLDMKTGRIAWKVNDNDIRKMGSAAVTCADGHLYFRYQNGMMKLVEANSRGYTEKGSFQIPNDQKNSWQHPVVAGGKLYLRAQNILYCYDIKSKG